jgi:hypothetical protein
MEFPKPRELVPAGGMNLPWGTGVMTDCALTAMELKTIALAVR